MRKRRQQPERKIPRAVISHLRLRAQPGVVYFAVPNGGYRNVVEARNLKLDGVTAGVSDIIMLHDGNMFALELKAEGGRPTESQLEFIDLVKAAGGYAVWVNGLDAALRTLECWGILKPSRSLTKTATVAVF